MNERMQVLDKSGKPLSSVYCIGDANGEPRHQLLTPGSDITYLFDSATSPQRTAFREGLLTPCLRGSRASQCKAGYISIDSARFCRKVYARACSQCSGHQCCGKYLPTSARPEPQFCPSSLLYSPRGGLLAESLAPHYASALQEASQSLPANLYDYILPLTISLGFSSGLPAEA